MIEITSQQPTTVQIQAGTGTHVTANPNMANTALLSKVSIDGTVFGLDGFSGNYDDLTNKPIIFSGDYNDLSNKPTVSSAPVSRVTIANTTSDGYHIPSGVDTIYGEIYLSDLTDKLQVASYQIPLVGDNKPPNLAGCHVNYPIGYNGILGDASEINDDDLVAYPLALWDPVTRLLRLQMSGGDAGHPNLRWYLDPTIYYYEAPITTTVAAAPTSPGVAASGNDYVTVTLWKAASSTPAAPAARWRWDDGFQGSFDSWHTVRQAAIDAAPGDPVYVAVGSTRRIATTSGPYAYIDTPYVVRAEFDTQYYADGVLQTVANSDTTHMRVREDTGSWSPLWRVKDAPPNSWELLLDSHGTYVINTSHSVNRTLPEEIDLAEYQAIRMDVEPFGADYSVDKGAVLSGVINRPDGGWKISTSTASVADNPVNNWNWTWQYDTTDNKTLTVVNNKFPNQGGSLKSVQNAPPTNYDGRVSTMVRRCGGKFHFHRPTLDGEKVTNVIFHSYNGAYTKVLIRFYGLRR